MRQVCTCSVLWLLVGSESAFNFVHFLGAEGLVMIWLEHAQVSTRCVWVNFTSSNLVSIKQIICRTRNRMLIYTYIYDNLQPMSSTCSLYPDYSSLRRLYKNLAYALTLGGSQPNPAPPEAYFNFIVAQPILGKKCDQKKGFMAFVLDSRWMRF